MTLITLIMKEENRIILTISIAMYNMEQYITRCLESIIIPDYSERYEILIINDGSKDKSLEIASDYAKQYPNIIRVIDKPNGNWGSCQNLAIKEAKGKYFRILDADDFFTVNDLRLFIDKLESLPQDVDIVETKCVIVHDNNPKHTSPQNLIKLKYDQIYDLRTITLSKENGAYHAMHNATLRIDLIRQANLYLQEGMSYTDIELFTYSLTYAKSIIFLDILLYRYFLGRDEQSCTTENYAKNIVHLERLFERMLNHRDEYLGEPGSNLLLSQVYYVTTIFSIYASMFILQKNQINDWEKHYKIFLSNYNTIKKILPELITNSYKSKHCGYHYIYLWDKYHITGYSGIGLYINNLFTILHRLYIKYYYHLN